MKASSLRVVVSGLMAQYPLGGLTWHYLQYVLGLQRLGHDLYYLEDSCQWPYDPSARGMAARGGERNASYLADVMHRFGLVDRWAYRFPGGVLTTGETLPEEWFGLSEVARAAVLSSADLLINVSSGLGRVEHYGEVRRLAFVDTDPVFTQMKLARGQTDFRRQVDAHHVHFSFGERLSEVVPKTGHHWRPTRQPVVLSEWECGEPSRRVFTTVMNWASYNVVTYKGVRYGGKDLEFGRFADLPRLVGPNTLELAVDQGKAGQTPKALLEEHGWSVAEAGEVSRSIDTYRDYIEGSMGEWSVAKNGYVQGQPGWFSERSACYLAAGRPVVVQDTGLQDVLPTGHGILVFRTLEEAAHAIHEVQSDFSHHSNAARALAGEHFDSASVLSRLVEEAMNKYPGIDEKGRQLVRSPA